MKIEDMKTLGGEPNEFFKLLYVDAAAFVQCTQGRLSTRVESLVQA
jgi:hypothetical protein